MRALPLLVTYQAKASVVRAMADELELPAERRDLSLRMFEAGLPPLSTTDWLPFLFGISPKLVGAMAARSERYYRRFQLRKRRGGVREIVTPRRYLKTIQRWLLEHVVSKLDVSTAAHGFVRRRNIFTNAEGHLGSRNLLVVDVADFFPTIDEARVRSMFGEAFEFPASVISQLAGLCTLNGVLPQGAPTSPALANAAFCEVDQKLLQLAKEWNVLYTRYADDMAFSGARKFSDEDVGVVANILEGHGFDINQGKTRVGGPGQRQLVAGLVVNEKAQPPREQRRRWRAMFHRASLHPHEFFDRVLELEGIAAFVAQYNEDLASQYLEVVGDIRAQMPDEQ